MPRINDRLLNSVIYLYPSAEDAAEGSNSGGSGFLVGLPIPGNDKRIIPYAVTNSHIIREAGCRVLRMNRKDGSVVIVPFAPENWYHHPYGDDVAVAHISIPDADANLLDFHIIPSSKFVTEEIVREYNIGPGDEVFLAGRLIGHDGKQRNLPSVRFGYIAMLPWEPIRHPRGILQDSFLVEMFSLGGSSGSPVFVYFRLFSLRPGGGKPPVTSSQDIDTLHEHNIGPLLLGVNWGHIPITEPIRYKSGELHPDDWVVHSHSGMAGVVPAWKILETLSVEELVRHRNPSL